MGKEIYLWKNTIKLGLNFGKSRQGSWVFKCPCDMKIGEILLITRN